MRIALGIATTGRPELLLRTVGEVLRQDRRADRIVVCPAQESDCTGLLDAFSEIKIVYGGRGLPRQRNAILREVSDCDALLFIDDDFIMAPDYLAALERLLTAHLDIVVATGFVIADGAHNAGIAFEDALDIIRMDSANRPASYAGPHPREGAYGCNMAVRLSTAYENGIEFDERLPLYGWLEDLDFSGRMRAAVSDGRVAGSPSLRGVHLGVKGGRQSGLRLGYSQVVNPVYISRKGVLPKRFLQKYVRRNIVANLARSAFPEPHIDRFGRLRGNVLGLWDLLRGRADPEKIELMR